MTSKISRRTALRGLFGGAAAGAVALALPKKAWYVGATIETATAEGVGPALRDYQEKALRDLFRRVPFGGPSFGGLDYRPGVTLGEIYGGTVVARGTRVHEDAEYLYAEIGFETVEGAPGLYKDLETGKIVNSRAFDESGASKMINRYIRGLEAAEQEVRQGLVGVEGQPGLLKNRTTDKTVNYRDFSPADRFMSFGAKDLIIQDEVSRYVDVVVEKREG